MRLNWTRALPLFILDVTNDQFQLEMQDPWQDQAFSSLSNNTPLVEFLVNAIRSLSATQPGAPLPMQPSPAQSRYHMARHSIEGSGTVILFYMTKQGEKPMLCLLGTDPKSTGHFTYRSHPSFPLPSGVLPHRSTNRSAALSFLASLGAKQSSESPVDLPPLSPGSIEAFTRNDPLFSRPESIANQSFTSWKEVTGLKCSDGRSLKQFYLVDERSGSMKLAVNAEDSHRRDRRYTYVTTPEFGSMKLENGAATRSWLDMCCDSMARDPSPAAATPSLPPAPPASFVMTQPQNQLILQSLTSNAVRQHLSLKKVAFESIEFVTKEPAAWEFSLVDSWVDCIQSLNRVRATLGEIERFPISLRLLVDTDVIYALQSLSDNTDPLINSMSKQIIARWKAQVAEVQGYCS
jgi:hypothetical protein